MATTPLFDSRDGIQPPSTTMVFSTNRKHIILTGTVDANTVDVQVSLNGQAFISDPTLILLNGDQFTIPNPSSFPDGLPLTLGSNNIRVRSIDIIGGVSSPATASITRLAVISDAESLVPTGIRLRRRRDVVDILVAVASILPGSPARSLEFRGFNFYASTSPAGTTGYFKINGNLVTEQSTKVVEEDTFEVANNSVEFDPQIDPRISTVRVRVTTEDVFGQEVSLVSDTSTIVVGQPGSAGVGQDPALFGGTGRELRFSQTLEEFERTNFVFFRHNRAGGTNHANVDQFTDVDDSEPLYYVVTGVYFNPFTGEEFETPFSQEVVGTPLVLDTRLRDLPPRTAFQITTDFISAVQRVNQEIALIPGSTTRDVSIDPFASEAERLWFIVDFVHRSQSFLTLLQIDDANGDGISDLVASSSYKQALRAALGITADSAVQALIDSQFDKLAGNLQTPRLPGRPAVGEVVFYTTVRPTRDIPIPSGTIVSSEAAPGFPAVRFVIGGTHVLAAANADAFFNFDTQRYEVVANIVAESPGDSGNRPAGQIKSVLGNVGGLSVTNVEATTFGTNRESNADLAVRAQLAYVSVDTGTEGGYTATAARQVGIVKNKIVKSGDPLMMRDYDEIRKKHIGGKVDIWVQGLRERTVTETFAFSFENARDIRCQIVDLGTLTLRVLDNRVTPDTPIDEILDNPSQGLGVRNVTLGQDYDLAGVIILDYQTFRLDASIQTFSTGIDDIITADYRFRSVNQFTPSFQPVRRVISVVGQAAGALDTTLGYDLFKTDDPLLNGESTIAQNFIRINQIGGLPSGASIAVTDEEHVMIGFFNEKLRSVGVNTATIRVFSEDRSIEYEGPGTASPDYEVIEGTATTPVAFRRTSSSAIVSGQTVVVDYEHDENFTVTYVINDLLQQLQRTVNVQRHITADVLVKQAILNSVEAETTIQLKAGASKDTTDPAVRTSVSSELNKKIIGEGTAQSDMINAIDSTTGVDFQVLPFAQMGYADGSRKIRELVSSSNQRLTSLDVGGQRVFILTNSLLYPTTDGGGLQTEHRGVFQDDEALVMAETLSTVGTVANQAFIIGSEGAIITDYSDDATITAETGLTDLDDIEAERLDRTANHVVVALSSAGVPPDDPINHDYACSYVIRGDRGPHDIQAAQVEYLELGGLSLTFREAG